MGETSWNVTVGHAPGVAGDLVVAVRSPRGPDFVTVMISPQVVEYRPEPVSSPGITVAGLVAMTPTEETVEFEIRVGAANKVTFAHRYYRYHITLMAIGKARVAELEGLEVETYTFYVELSGDALEEFDQVIDQGAATLPEQQRRAAAMFNKGNALFLRNQEATAIPVLTQVVNTYAGVEDPILREIVGRALQTKVRCFQQLKRSFEEASTYQEIVDRLPDPRGPVERFLVAASLLNLGARRYVTDPDGAIALWEDVPRRFASDTESMTSGIVADARSNRAIALEQQGSPDALGAYDELVTLYGDRPDAAATRVTAIALLNRAGLLGKVGRIHEALALYQEVVSRFRQDQRPEVFLSVGLSLFGIGYYFAVLGRELMALTLYAEVVAGVADSADPQLREVAAKALENALLILEKREETDAARSVREEIVRRFADAPEPALKAIVARHSQPAAAAPA